MTILDLVLVAEPYLKKILRDSIFSEAISNFSIYMKVTIISLGRVKVSILNELNEKAYRMSKRKDRWARYHL